MDARRARLIAEVVKHLEDLDGEELGGMAPKAEVEIEVEKKPEAEMEIEGDKAPMGEDELTDEEFEERLKM